MPPPDTMTPVELIGYAHLLAHRLHGMKLERLAIFVTQDEYDALLRHIGAPPSIQHVTMYGIDILIAGDATPADGTIDGDGVWMGGVWHPKNPLKAH